MLCHVCVHSRDALSIQSPSHYASNWACPELIYEILTYCLSGVTLRTDAPRSFPWYLGHICQSWRSVFVSSPCFWDRFSFETHSMEEISLLQRTLALVELCIERTKDRPFSFDFRVSRIYDDIVPSPLLLETLVAHADRWRAACLMIDINQLKPLTTSDSITHILSAVAKSWGKHQFPKLRFVSVHVNDDHSKEIITFAIADLMRVGADKGVEIDINSSPLPTKVPFW